MTLSNKLTFARLLAAPVFFILFWIDKAMNQNGVTLGVTIILIILLTFSEISDAMDGRLARSRNEVTDFGKLFDPFADSVSRFTFFFCFWWLELCPAWMVVVIFYRDAAISFLRLVVRGENVVLAARKSGKFKAVSQATAIYLILAARLVHVFNGDFPLHTFSTWVIGIVAVITVASMMDYLAANMPVLKNVDM